uniref:Uncharacterized protein n=1 Tax=Panagrolaimus superbus TaxID=310955 RepID=A0A914Y302_9BILA
MDDHQATTMPEEAAILKINELIDALFEQSEESVLRLDVNQRKFERSGKFAAKKNEKNEFLVLNRFGGDKNKKICTIESSSRSPSSSSSLTKTLISSGKSPSTASSSLRTRNSVTSQGKSLEYEPSLLCLDPESYEILSH